MKPPSPLCLLVLRQLSFPSTSPLRFTPCTQRKRHYASKPPPPPAQPPPPRPRQESPPPLQPPNEDDPTPHPLTRPLGLPYPPQPGDNTGLDTRTLSQRRDDFVDYDKHLARRAQMTKQISRPYFRDWSNLRFAKGKAFRAPARLVRRDVAGYFPNFFGRRLLRSRDEAAGGLGKKDGFGGLGRDTCLAMFGRVSVVSFVGNAWALRQVQTFVSPAQNPALADVLDRAPDVAQRVEIHYEDDWLKWWILRLFGLRRLRAERSLEQQGRYFLVRRGLGEEVKAAMGMGNEEVGFVYLVDAEGRIRWAGSAVSEEGERESLVRGLRKLVLEVRREREEAGLEEKVAEVVESVAVG